MSAVRIVLFGMHGQLGSRLITALTAAGYEVTGIDRIRCDFTIATAKEIGVIIRAVEPQLVINATAYTAVDKAEDASEHALAQRINATIPEMIATIASEQAVPFLHFSTDYVFDGLRGAPYREDAPTNPVNTYAITKHAGEVGVIAHGGHVFRLQWVFNGRGKNFFTTIKKLLADRSELRVVADQVGSPSNAVHIAAAVAKAVPLLLAKTLPAGIYHLTAQGHASWHGFACAIAQAVGSPASVVPIITSEYPLPAARPKDARLDCSALASYGIAMPHWSEGVTQAMEDAHEAA